MENIISLAAANGIWAVLFVFLFFYELKDSKIREAKYQKTIDKLTEQLTVVYDIKDSLEEIKENEKVFRRNFVKSQRQSS